MRKIKLKSQPKWIVRMMFGIGAVAGLLLAFHTHPIGGTNAQSIDCPEGQYLATGDVCITNDKDIVIQATATVANQKLKINKYFANAYTVDRGDGTTGDLTADTTHTYATAGTYNIILSLTGTASRWTFQNVSTPLVPTYGTTVTGVQITYMPSLAEGFGNSATNPGHYFFNSFNRNGSLTSLPEGSFNTSKITTVGTYFFSYFNSNGSLTSLPEGSFDTSNISGSVGNYFFNSFNRNGSLTSLPEGSFDTSNITRVGDYFFSSFNQGGSLTSLPAGSFDTSNISRSVGNNFFYAFNSNGSLTSLPEGSFDTSNITTVGDYFFTYFNYYNGKLTSLPEGSFDTSNITTVGNSFFSAFNRNGILTSLPAGSFDTSNITTVGSSFFASFNENGKLTSLPEGSFDTSNITTVWSAFFNSFNSNGSLTSLPEGSFDTSNIRGSVGGDFFSSFNSNGSLTSLPEGSFDTSNITTAGTYFFYQFNYQGALTSLPDSFKLTSAAYNKTNGYTNAFNSPNRTLNRKVSDLVSGVTAPAGDRNTFSDNQPGRCGVDPNWLVNRPTNCISIVFDTQGGSVVDTGYTELGEIWTRPTENPTKQGYTFVDWYTSTEYTELFDFSIPATQSEVVYAKWLCPDGTHAEGDTCVDNEHEMFCQTGNIANAIYYIENVTGTWNSGINSYDVPSCSWTCDTGYTKNIDSCSINQYTITFDTDGGSAISPITGDFGSAITVPANPTKDGYDFVGWDQTIPVTMPAENIVITALWTAKPAPRPSSGGGGGGGGGTTLRKDNCPGGDFSDSYYDGVCGENPKDSSATPQNDSKESSGATNKSSGTEGEGSKKDSSSQAPQNDGQTPQNDKTDHNSADDFQYDTLKFNPKYSDEMNQAYQYAYHYGITTKDTIRNADVNGKLTRVAMAKMLSQYAINVLGMKPDTTRQKTFSDVSTSLDLKYDNGVTLAYQLGIMGINMPNNEFMPNNYVTRAQFVTALSRLLYSMSDGKYEKTSLYYTNHMNKLYNEGIITNTDPTMLERRGYVMLMLMRSEAVSH